MDPVGLLGLQSQRSVGGLFWGIGFGEGMGMMGLMGMMGSMGSMGMMGDVTGDHFSSFRP